tara:strand:+ start:391 stop:975 length:585 start_codon:yes stop_codon:yes gene_type:complete
MSKPLKNDNIYGVYNPSVLTQKVYLMITEVGKTVKQNIEREILHQTTGKCIAEGILKPNSVRIINYSSGAIRGDKVEFQVVFECMICHPVEGMLLYCIVKTITKAGIHAAVIDQDGSVPVTVFIARDHHFTNTKFANVTENEKILANVIGIRFELNDPYICAIARLTEPRPKSGNEKERGAGAGNKPPLSILED